MNPAASVVRALTREQALWEKGKVHMKKLVVGIVASVLVSLASPAMASLVNVNTNNTLHPNNDLRSSGQCDRISATVR